MFLFHECMNCGDLFEPEHSQTDYICDYCYFKQKA